MKVIGAENIPPTSDPRGVILAPNHESFLDPPLVGLASDREVTYLAKEYLFRVFLVGSILRAIKSFPVKSEADDFRTIRALIKVLQNPYCVVIFPEGTRTEDGNLKPGQTGIGFLAIKSGAHVVPTFIEGSFEAFPKGKKMFRPHPLSVHFGKAFIPAEDAEIQAAADPNLRTVQRIMEDIAVLKEKYKRD